VSLTLLSSFGYYSLSLFSLDLTRALVGFLIAGFFVSSFYLVEATDVDIEFMLLPISDPKDTPFPPNDLNALLFDSSLGALLELPLPPTVAV